MDSIISISESPLGNYISFSTIRNLFLYDIKDKQLIYPEKIQNGEVCPILSTCWFPNEQYFAYATDSKELFVVDIVNKLHAKLQFVFVHF